MSAEESEDVYERGLAKRREMLGSEIDKRMSYLAKLAPDLDRNVIERLFGDIYCRPGLDPRARSLCTITALATLGHEVQLKAHITGARNVGVTREEIVEAFVQLQWYAGLPVASTALRIAGEVFRERGEI